MAIQNYLDATKYSILYQSSITEPEDFWATQANEFIDWIQPWDTVSNCDFTTGKIHWYNGAKLNAAYNCIDRHLKTNPSKTAIIWEGNDPTETRAISYQELHQQVCKLANVLKSLGVKAGDRVSIYLPMIPEVVVSMLACARIGAIHSVIFGGFSAEALRTRILDCQSKIVITANEGLRGEKKIPLKTNVDHALKDLETVTSVIVINRTNNSVAMQAKRDHNYADLMANASTDCEYHAVNAEDPLFILYTSGSTGKPKGVQHSTGGYLTFAAMTFHYVFDYHPQEVYWCSADAGWITGHTYLVYGPLANGATILMYEGIPTHPDPARMWQIIDKHKVNIFYTAPTLLRSLMAHGDRYLQTTSRATLRILGTVGEPINPAAWEWYYNQVGHARCPIVDTWWQTETGGILITPLPGVTQLKPGSATKPFFGIEPIILDEQGKPIIGEGEGYLVFAKSWPGQMQTLYGDHQRFMQTYFSRFPGYYFSGDGAKRDADGYYWITGRVDDVLNVSGHRIGTAEVESALVKHPAAAEAAVVGVSDEITGESVYAFVQIIAGYKPSKELERELIATVKAEIGAFAAPKTIHFADELPKTRSGKIMRRILRKIAAGEIEDLGDISTLGNQDAVNNLIKSNKT
jgi:acetyl-CoA synthetase